MADPQSLTRVIALFAQRAIFPDLLAIHPGAGRVRIDVTVSYLAAAHAEIIAEKLRAAVVVLDVSLNQTANLAV